MFVRLDLYPFIEHTIVASAAIWTVRLFFHSLEETRLYMVFVYVVFLIIT